MTPHHDTSVRAVLLSNGRSTEWLASIILFVMAFILAIPGNSLSDLPAFVGFVQLGIDETWLIFILTTVSTLRMAALFVNGRWHRSPDLRMVGAVVGAGIYAAFAATFVTPYAIGQSAALSTAAGTYAVLSAFDIVAAYRSARDARNARISKRS